MRLNFKRLSNPVDERTRDGRKVFTTSDGKYFYVEAKAIAHQNKITDKMIDEIEREAFEEDIRGFGGGGRGRFSARSEDQLIDEIEREAFEMDVRGLKPGY